MMLGMTGRGRKVEDKMLRKPEPEDKLVARRTKTACGGGRDKRHSGYERYPMVLN